MHLASGEQVGQYKILSLIGAGVLIMNAHGSNTRVLFDDPVRSAVAPVWSPRGDRIAFALGQFFPFVPGRERVTSRLVLIGTDGRGLQVLTAAGERAGFPSWSATASGWSTARRKHKGEGCELSTWLRIESRS